MAMMPVIKQNLSDNIKHDLKKYILDMDLKESAKLPPEVEIGRKFGVSRVTVRRALDETGTGEPDFPHSWKGDFCESPRQRPSKSA